MSKTKTQPGAAAKPSSSRASRSPAAPAVADESGALGSALSGMSDRDPPADDMADNDQPMHQGLHDGHDAERVADASIHDADLWPENWAAPEVMQAPPCRPGMVQRFVRMSLKGQVDANNVSNQSRNGWRPRTLESVPEGDRKSYPTMKDPRSAGHFIVNGDLVLCEMPKRLFDQMETYFRNKRKGQVSALVDSQLAGDAVRGGEKHGFHAPEVVERTTHVTKGRSPLVAGD